MLHNQRTLQFHGVFLLLLSLCLIACDMSGNEEEDEAGEMNAGESTAGEMSAGEIAAGEMGAGESAAGEINAGEDMAGEMSAGEMSAGEMSAGEMSAGEMSAGEMSAGEMSAGEMSAGGMGSWSIWETDLPCADQGAMYWDDDQTGFWGCGRRGDEGMWSTTDGGMTWTEQRRINAKINGFTRGATGRLYAAGQFGGPVALIDDSNPMLFSLTPLFERSNQASTSVQQGETVAVTSDGQILSDSLTGTTAAYFPGQNTDGQAWLAETCTEETRSYTRIEGDNGTWCELSGVSDLTLRNPEASSGQVTNLIVHEDRFYAAGRWIADEGKVRLPTQASGLAPYHMTEVKVQTTGTGEMLDISIDGQGNLYAAGTDGDANTPLIYRCSNDSDCYETSSWTRIEPDFMFLEQYWIDGMSARDGRAIASYGDTTVAIGNFVPNARGGWAIITRDGGATWEDLTTELVNVSGGDGRLGMFYDVHVFASGKVVIIGDVSYVYTP